MTFESRIWSCFEIKALSPQEGWLPFKDLAKPEPGWRRWLPQAARRAGRREGDSSTQRSEQGRVRGDVKAMRNTLLGLVHEDEELFVLDVHMFDQAAVQIGEGPPQLHHRLAGAGRWGVVEGELAQAVEHAPRGLVIVE